MNKKYLIIFIIAIVLGVGILGYVWLRNYQPSDKSEINTKQNISITTQSELPQVVDKEKSLVEPVADFKSRITKKKFGDFITPENSPIANERFAGYHTGADVEYDDVDELTEVIAISDGEVVYKQKVNGYGGLMIVKHNINGQELLVLYGHINTHDAPGVGDKVEKGVLVTYLGENKSEDTDGERKHLHFGILKGSGIDVRGYVQNEEELDLWHNPLEFY